MKVLNEAFIVAFNNGRKFQLRRQKETFKKVVLPTIIPIFLFIILNQFFYGDNNLYL